MRHLPLSFLLLLAACSAGAPAPCGPVPSAAQLEWQRMEVNMFCHFGPNTFSGLEWGLGTEPEDLFAPTALDCRQWARTAAAAGMKGIIITAKHHDGFCLWPNPESTHTVASSPWRDGRGDVLRELSDACREYGLKFGVYISPWDRFDPDYGSPAYNENTPARCAASTTAATDPCSNNGSTGPAARARTAGGRSTTGPCSTGPCVSSAPTP